MLVWLADGLSWDFILDSMNSVMALEWVSNSLGWILGITAVGVAIRVFIWAVGR
jgi:hypothetical protein